MNIFKKLLPEDLYHSYLVEGSFEQAGLDLVEYLKEKKIITDNDPDFFYQRYESLTIQNSREIKSWHSQLSVKKEGKKVCLIETNFINREAEQALLKVMEEPGLNTHFFIITPNISILKDTTKSRVHSLRYLDEQNKEISEIAKKIISSPLKNRFEIISDLVKENKNEDSSGSLRRYANLLLSEIEKIVYLKFKKDLENKDNIFILEEISKNKKYLNYPGAAVKMILEHIALIL